VRKTHITPSKDNKETIISYADKLSLTLFLAHKQQRLKIIKTSAVTKAMKR